MKVLRKSKGVTKERETENGRKRRKGGAMDFEEEKKDGAGERGERSRKRREIDGEKEDR